MEHIFNIIVFLSLMLIVVIFVLWKKLQQTKKRKQAIEDKLKENDIIYAEYLRKLELYHVLSKKTLEFNDKKSQEFLRNKEKMEKAEKEIKEITKKLDKLWKDKL